ncbi:MAG: hypothetical protein ACYCVH_07210 [Ignavibacteriaceae bacterium]
MKESGTSPQAVKFAKLTDNQGYLRDFKKFGKVGVAYSYSFKLIEHWFNKFGSPMLKEIIDNLSQI